MSFISIFIIVLIGIAIATASIVWGRLLIPIAVITFIVLKIFPLKIAIIVAIILSLVFLSKV